MSKTVDEVLLLGDPGLRIRCAPIADPRDPEVGAVAGRLLAVLDRFRQTQGFGRGIAAPQIGEPIRIAALRLDGWPTAILNPRIIWRSDDSVTLWDDCMSFPFLLVRLRRAASISVEFDRLDGQRELREHLDTATSELLQHEIDHLDGVLAVDHALDSASLVARDAFARDPDYFLGQVDYRTSHRWGAPR